MSQDILITPKSGEPQILFRGSGVNDTAIELNVLSSYQSATGSGSALLFEGEQGQLFAITDNLSSGVIFSVADITGLPAIEYNASGELSLGEYASNITIYSNNGLVLNSGTPSSTTDSLYNTSGTLYFNGSPYMPLPPSGLESQILYKVSDSSNELAWIDNYATELRELVKNDTGSGILKGTVVMATGAVGDRIQVAPAVADGSVEPRYMFGVASEDIDDSTEGYVSLVGPIKGISTSGWAVGTVLWIDPSNPGGLTSTQPTSPDLQMSVAIVTNESASNGRIFVRMWEQQPGLHELHDVNVDTVASGDLIAYDSSNGVWTNIENPSGVLQGQITQNANDIVAVSGVAASAGTVQGTDATYDIQAKNEGATAGNARGENSVDLQTKRSAATQVASGSSSVVSGGENNVASASSSTVGGGKGNTASNISSTIGGGSSNVASASNSTVGGGNSNTASNYVSTVGGGKSNTASACVSTVSGGRDNTASASYSSVAGGCCNITNARHSIIAGGHRNIIQSPTNECCSRGATIGGGVGNNTSGGTFNATTGDITGTITCYNAGAFSSIGGGVRNRATGACSTASGGCGNCSTGSFSTIGGGAVNSSSTTGTTVGGGSYNNSSASYSTVSGGCCNTSSGQYSVVSGGSKNASCDFYSTISGGYCNVASACCSTVSGGASNAACAINSSISGGCANFANARHSTIAGGHRNTIQSPTNECCSRGATISGGAGHNSSGGTIDATTGDITGAITCCNAGRFSTIGGGLRNCATDTYNTIGGGLCNTTSYCASTVSGGIYNTASGGDSTIGGGSCNTASGTRSTVGGGHKNIAAGSAFSYATVAGGVCNTACGSSYSTVGGGAANTASAPRSTVGGGQNNTACGNSSTIIGGYQAIASKHGEFAHAAGKFTQNGDAQHSILVARKNTTDATANVVLFLDGTDDRLVIPAETTWMFTIKLAAHNDTNNDGAWWYFRGGIRRDASNNTTLIGNVFEEYAKDTNMSSASASVVADDTNEALEIRVTGVASKDIRWVAVIDLSQVSWGTP